MAIFLHKETVNDFDGCIKSSALEKSDVHPVKTEIGLSGKIYTHHPTMNPPSWKSTLDKLSSETINLVDNSSNKAAVVFKHRDRYLSVTYGYGKSMLDEDTIERNFGLIVAANLIDPQKIRSLNSMTIEDTIVDTQKQAVAYSNQENFQINQNREILKAVSGAPNSESTAKFLVGTDSLIATRKMRIENIKESIVFYFDKYQSKEYIDKGFGWLDNIKRVKDSTKNTFLDSKLAEDVRNENSRIIIGPNRVLNWENISGFYFSGMGKTLNNDISINLDYEKYLRILRSRPEINIIDKLKRDKIIAVAEDDDMHFPISKVYDGIVYEISNENKKYLLCYGDWYEVDENYYTQIRTRVANAPICAIQFVPCKKGIGEGLYNTSIADSSDNYVLLDQHNYSIPGHGHSTVEPCDILTKDKKIIHVKKGGSSSKLSHLFAQGLVSARLLSNDDGFKNHINDKVKSKFGENFIEASDMNSDFEIVYAIIDHTDKDLVDVIPFFSLVNLSQTLEHLDSMNYNYSLMKIDVID